MTLPPGPPRRTSTRDRLRSLELHNLPAAVVLVCALGGIVFSAVVPDHWLRGVLFTGGALVMAGVLRAVLPVRQAGLLVVRGRVVDVIVYAGLGAALWLVGLWLPSTR